MAAGFGSWTNMFVPGFSSEMTEKLIVDLKRDWQKAPALALMGTHVQSVPQGYFARTDPSTQGLLVDDPQSLLWPDGTPYPVQEDTMRKFDFIKWDAQRYTCSTVVGDDQLEFASWDLQAQVTSDLQNKAALNRIKRFYTQLNTTGNYTTIAGIAHTDTATNLAGGKWNSGTSANRYIQKTFAAVTKQMEKSSVNGLGGIGERILLISPDVADQMARSQEIADGFHRTTDYSKYLQYDLWQNQFDMYGLPPILYGWVIVVDPWVKVTSKIGATDARSFVGSSTSAYFMVKPGGITSASGGKSFGSWELFTVKGKELQTEVIDEPKHKWKIIRTNDYFDILPICRESSYLVTAAVD